MQLDLPECIHEKAWFASALSLAASCLSSSVISLGSTKLSVDSVGEGMTDEGGVAEEGEDDDDSLMLSILSILHRWSLPYSIRLYLYSLSSGRVRPNKNLLNLHPPKYTCRTTFPN